MDKEAIVNLHDFDPYNVCETRKLVEWTLGHCIFIANHHACLCSASVDVHQDTDMLIFIAVCYPLNKAYHAQYLSINVAEPNFIDTIMDSVRSIIQLVQLQPTYTACLCCGQGKHGVPACPSTSPDKII